MMTHKYSIVMPDKSPRVAILLAAYNGVDFIEQQLETILCQNGVSVTIFISVDLSTDGSYTWCCDFAEDRNNIHVLPYGERFGGAAKNFFRLVRDIDFVGFDYIAFADQDDIWSSDKLFHGIKQMESEKSEAYSASVIAFWEDGREKLIDKSQPQRELDYLFEAAGPGCTYIFTNKAAVLIKKYLFDFPELNDFVLHDWLSYAILRHSKVNWFIDSIPKMRYRQHDSNQVGANASIKGKIYRAKYVLSGQGFRCIDSLVSVLDIPSINLLTRMGILKLAFNASQLRRRRIDQFLAFSALLIYAIKGANR